MAGTRIASFDRTTEGLSRRDLIRRAAAAGAVTWSAPILYGSLFGPAGAQTISGCSGIKITPGTSNCGNVELCNDFQTGGPDLSCLATQSTFGATMSFPGGFWTIKLCGILATGLTGTSAKWSGNLSGCESTVGGVAQQGADCQEAFGPAGGGTSTGAVFPLTQVNMLPYTVTEGNANPDCPANIENRVGHVIILYPFESATAAQPVGDTVAPPNLGSPGLGCRWLFVDILPNINAVGLQVCFVVQSPPAGCGTSGNCAG